MRMAVTI